MASLTKLRRQHLRWVRYDRAIRPRAHGYRTPFPPGLLRTGRRVVTEQRRRQLFIVADSPWSCYNCSLPDLYGGAGDGIGSCDCRGCEWCHARPGDCDCYRLGDDEDWPDDEDDAYGPPRVITVDTGGLL